MENWSIRRIENEDNQAVAKLIRAVFDEMEIPKTGTAYEDPYLDLMFEEYNKPQSVYLVVENEGRIVGCAGIAPLENGSAEICELQKMYFLPETRGLGIGSVMMEKCLQQARDFGFKKCYIETMPFMHAAQKLYKKSGFEYLDAPMGCTGHSSCPVWMLKDLHDRV
ncbi:GNAT family N-acetyltransferase [Flavobacterium circumlabens]|uniref:Acetyltransferase n=1 Tax=Flavobacterium circumlabens TaxID=2133765 RepID=A0A4Y7U6B9_9FLAO|nr:GNAT family N-acetyltransferase [Flavobacterium circumlabens]TCN51589.1 putative acetyltransferase [Flavobacterium circumlabens]TEB41987.1 GNAT family N-acetyltransferase [Flavobacterium circumlabens]